MTNVTQCDGRLHVTAKRGFSSKQPGNLSQAMSPKNVATAQIISDETATRDI